jgi:uncharacterized protein YdiU (UPF0061 family)
VLAWSRDMARRLGLDEADIEAPAFARVFGGNALWPGMQPFAANYGGHQFGHWAGQLGDGRAISLGEAIGEDGARWELQLKGAGRTPYSRSADGRAVLRDMFYDGHPREEPGAIVCRAAPSFLRFGNFELPASRGDTALLRALADFCLRRDFPELEGSGETLYSAWFRRICESTATMIAHWMRVGFVHGVMNTDNMSILGLTIDYGPYGWIDAYDPGWTPNTTDAHGRRYRFGWQPKIAGWNLLRLAHALSPLFAEAAPLQAGLDAYAAAYDAADRRNVAAKLGLRECRDGDLALMADLQALLHDAEVDMALFVRALADVDLQAPALAPLADAFYDDAKHAAAAPRFEAWLARLAARTGEDGTDPEARRAAMDASNPKYVLRNYLAQEAIDKAEQGDLSGVHALQRVMEHPCDEQPGREAFAVRRPDWARDRAGCSMLSCSS